MCVTVNLPDTASRTAALMIPPEFGSVDRDVFIYRLSITYSVDLTRKVTRSGFTLLYCLKLYSLSRFGYEEV